MYSDYNDEWQNLVHLWKMFKLAELTEVMRQKGDDTFIDLLNNVRTATLNDQDEKLLKSRFVQKNNVDYPTNVLHIFAENSPADEHNSVMLNEISSDLYSIKAIDEIPRKIHMSNIQRALNKNQSETGGLAGILSIKVNAKVMLTININIDDRLINGQMGTVCKINTDNEGQIVKVYIKFDDEKAGLKLINSNDVIAKRNNWVPIERVEASIKLKVNKDSSPIIKRTQFPLKLSWPCTVHKVQGLSLAHAVVCFDLNKQRTFNYGQMYVALSRVTSLKGIFLTGQYKRNCIKSNPKTVLEYDRLRNETIEDLGILPLEEASLTISLLNTRSLTKHVVDIARDETIYLSDIICLTETHISPDQDIANIHCHLKDFNFIHIDEVDRFQSIGVFHRNIHVTDCVSSTGVLLIKFKKDCFSLNSINMLLKYRKQSWSLPSFYDAIQDLVTTDNIHIILGDFNINAFTQDIRLTRILHDCKMIVNVPTHLSGSLLDHVYVKETMLQDMNLEVTLKNVYFSDHDAVKFKLSMKL